MTTAVITKRRPGRPRKTENLTATATMTATEIAPVKRGPGRPRKNPETTMTATATEIAPVKRRGRPKGSKNKPKVTETATAPTAPAVKRGPGRPRKNPEAVTATAPAAKRRPGRPKGSKNKPKVTETTSTEATATAPAVKRGPGRPRKNPEAVTATAPVAKRRPGRPKGSKNKPKVTQTATAPTAPVVKRGPGRPRKNATVTAPRTVSKDKSVRQVLFNPFKAGDSVSIPSGVTYTSTAPTAKGRQVARRGHKVTVMDIIPARVQPRKSETGSSILVRPPRIRAKGSGGYWKDITLNEKILRLNGMTPAYETIKFNLSSETTTA